jgi:hypothetical protein
MDANWMAQDLAQRTRACNAKIDHTMQNYLHLQALKATEQQSHVSEPFYARLVGWLRKRFAGKPVQPRTAPRQVTILMK